MEDSIGDSRRSSNNADLAYAFDAKRIDPLVDLLDKNDVNVMDVGVHRHMIFAEVWIYKTPKVVISQRLLVQSHADTPDDSAKDLATRRFGIEDAAGRHGVDYAWNANDAQFLVDSHLREDR